MKRFLTMALILVAMVVASAQLLTPVANARATNVGGCGCSKTTPVCCHNCDGTFAYCARSFANCPECAAP
jgi:hypothetical protein